MILFTRQIWVMLLTTLAIIGMQTVWAQTQTAGKPKLAVYVFGAEESALNKAMATQLITALANTGSYQAADNYKEFFNKVAEEHKDGIAPGLERITSIGQQFGVEYICVALISNVSGEKQVGAQIVDVKTVKIAASGSSNVPLRTKGDLSVASEQIVKAMSNSATQKTAGSSNTFTDTRDGKTYRTVKIGKQTWMAQNLNYKTVGDANDTWIEEAKTNSNWCYENIEGTVYKTVRMCGSMIWIVENPNYKTDSSGCYENSWCYENKEANCKKYGRMYNWDAAMKACPTGWHLPTRDEWNDLVTVAGGKVAGRALKSKTGWEKGMVNGLMKDGNGTDSFGFSALPGGFWLADTGGDGDGDVFAFAGKESTWWEATEDGNEGYACQRYMRSGETSVSVEYGLKCFPAYVRCLQDN